MVICWATSNDKERFLNVQQCLGLARSLIIYGAPWRQPRLRRFYRPFVTPGDVVFDIGAHLGDRSLAFAALGARVVAVEPQPDLQTMLRWRLRRYPDAKVITDAIGAAPGSAKLALSDRNPTLATLDKHWREHIGQANAAFADVHWEREIPVNVVTLEALIKRYGRPVFCKIDVEGAEGAVLAGLHQPLPALSFEYVSGSQARALDCIDQLMALGSYRFNVTIGERRAFVAAQAQSVSWVRAWLKDNAQAAGSGDVYAYQSAAGA